MKSKGKIYISYRRAGGIDLATLIREVLKRRGYEVFMDIEDLRHGSFSDAILEEIQSSSDVIVVLTPNSLDRCLSEEDWMRHEIANAFMCEKNVIPVIARGFSFPDFPLPEEIAKLPLFQ